MMERKEGLLLILTVESSPQQAILIDSENDILTKFSRKGMPLLGLKSCAMSSFVPLSYSCSVLVTPALLQHIWVVVCVRLCLAVTRDEKFHIAVNSSHCPPACRIIP